MKCIAKKLKTVPLQFISNLHKSCIAMCSTTEKRQMKLRKWQPTPVFTPGKSHGSRSLVGYNPQGHKESDTTERLLCVCVFRGLSITPPSFHHLIFFFLAYEVW